MTALYIILGVLAVLLWLFTRHLHLYLEYIGGEIRICVRLLFIKKQFPTAEHKPQKQKAEQKAPQKQAQTAQQDDGEKPKLPVKELLSDAFELIKRISKKLGRHLKVQKSDIRVTVATGDVMTTATAYGAASGIAAQITELLLKMKHSKKAYIHTLIEPDFICDKPIFFCDIHLKIRLCSILSMAFDALRFIIGAYPKIKPLLKTKNKNKSNNDNKKEQNDAERNASQTDN